MGGGGGCASCRLLDVSVGDAVPAVVVVVAVAVVVAAVVVELVSFC